MRPELWPDTLFLHAEEESLWGDFLLAFAFFTALSYAVLGKRFDHQRSAVTISTAIGLALSVGLVWWEHSHDLSIRNLGPVAVGVALAFLGLVMFKAIRSVAGSWAAASLAIGISLIVATTLRTNLLIDAKALLSVISLALVMGILTLLIRQASQPRRHSLAPRGGYTKPEPYSNVAELDQEKSVSETLSRKLKLLNQQVDKSRHNPAAADEVFARIKEMLPAQGWLTERMAQLRRKAHCIRNGHIARLEETKHLARQLTTDQKKKAAAQLIASYKNMVGIDLRLERLDKAVAANELRICDLTRRAGRYAASYDFRQLHDILAAAEKLQRQNSTLFKKISQAEMQLSGLARKGAVAQQP